MQSVGRCLFLLSAILIWSEVCSAIGLFRIITPSEFLSADRICKSHCAKKENPGGLELPCLTGCHKRLPSDNSDDDDDKEDNTCFDGCRRLFPIPLQSQACQFGCQCDDDSESSDDHHSNDSTSSTDTKHSDYHSSNTELATVSGESPQTAPKPSQDVIGSRTAISTVTVNGRGVNIKRVTLIVRDVDGSVKEVALPPKVSPFVPAENDQPKRIFPLFHFFSHNEENEENDQPTSKRLRLGNTDTDHQRTLYIFPLSLGGHAIPKRPLFGTGERERVNSPMFPEHTFAGGESFKYNKDYQLSYEEPFLASLKRWEIPLVILAVSLTILLLVACCSMAKHRPRSSEFVANTVVPLSFDGSRRILSVSDLIGDCPPKYTPVARTDSSDEFPKTSEYTESEKAPLV